MEPQPAPAGRARSNARWLTSALLLLAVVVPCAAVVFRLGPLVTGPARFALRALAVALPLLALGLLWRRLRGPRPSGSRPRARP